MEMNEGAAASRESIAQFLSRRRTEIEAVLLPLQKEHAEIVAAQRAIQSYSSTSRRSPGIGTIQDMALGALDTLMREARGAEIAKTITDIYGVTLPRTSLAPQLSRLRQKGLVTLDRGRRTWAKVNSAGAAQ